MRFLPAMLVVLFLCCPLSVFAVDVQADHFERTFDVSGKPSLSVKNNDGVTRITAGTGSTIRVDVSKDVLHAKNEEDAKKRAEQVSVSVTQTGSLVEVLVKRHAFRFGIHINEPEVRVRLLITAPPESDIEAHSGDGNLEVSGFRGGQFRLHSTDGEMTVSDCAGNSTIRSVDGTVLLQNLEGRLEFKLTDGKAEVRNVSGDVRMTAGDGRISIAGCSGTQEFAVRDGELRTEDCSGTGTMRISDGKLTVLRYSGSLEASGRDGRVDLNGVFDSLVAKTSDGSLSINAESGSQMLQNWSIESRDGDIQLSLPESFEGDVDFTTRDGRITTDVPVTVVGSLSQNHLTGKIRQSGKLLRIRTSDGDISVASR